MAFILGSRAAPPIVYSCSALRRRLPLVGAFCVLSFGISSLRSTFSSSSFKSGAALSLPFASDSRLKLADQRPSKSLHSIRMEGKDDSGTSGSVVPSIVVYVTVPDKETGKKLAKSIVGEKLAACVNIVPGIESVYQWKGEIESDSEELLIIKTRESLLDALTEHVKANHPYDVPEVIALPINGGSLQYLEWIKTSTRD